MSIDTDLDTLQRDVRYLRDRTAVLDCIARHARGCDRHDVDLISAAYHADDVDEHGFVINPGPEYGNWANGTHAAHASLCTVALPGSGCSELRARGILSTRRHPAVRDACVVGVADRRLGEVPFAAIEVRPGSQTPSESELKDRVRQSLPSHHVPVAITVVDALPRNAAMKVRPADVAALYDAR